MATRDEIQTLLDSDEIVSDWMTIEQHETDQFARLTDDEDPMHNDPAWAATTHWGGTIVQAAHVLSLGVGQVTALPVQTVSNGSHYVLNYGYDRVRVIAPLRVGHPFRYRTKIVDVREKSADAHVIKVETTVEGRETPFMVYEGLIYWAHDQEMAEPDEAS